MGKPAARITDMHVCPMMNGPVPHVGGPISPPGCPTVLIGGLPAARVGDMAICAGPPDSIVVGAFTVLIGGQPAARMGDQTAHGGTIAMGFPTVLIGESGSGGGAGGGGGGAAGGGGGVGAAASALASAFSSAAQSGASQVPAAPGPLAGTVPADRVSLAASAGDGPEQREARRQVARAFYGKFGQKLDRSTGELRPMLPREIDDHVDGIDLSKPVSAGPPPELPGGLTRWGPPGGISPGGGSYAAPPSSSPSELGIGPLTTTASGETVAKQPFPAPATPRGTPYLQSSAAPIDDTWSAKHPDGSPMTQPTVGGSDQYYVPSMIEPPPAAASS